MDSGARVSAHGAGGEAVSPTARSRKHLSAEGWHVATVEQTIPHVFIKRDAFGWADLLCVHPTKGIALVQVTTGDHLANRIAKARTVAGPLVAWLIAGGKLVAHGWRQLGPKGSRKRWEVREVELGLKDLEEPVSPGTSSIEHTHLVEGTRWSETFRGEHKT